MNVKIFYILISPSFQVGMAQVCTDLIEILFFLAFKVIANCSKFHYLELLNTFF